MRFLLLISVFFSASIFANNLNDLNYITESYPPFNYHENKELKGLSVDVLEAATKAVGEPVSRSDIKLQPWARGYDAALKGPKVALFATTRTEEREPKFKWVGPIIATKVVVFSNKNVTISDPSEFSNYKIGVVRDDVGEALLKKAGVPESAMKVSPGADLLIKQLAAGRIDMLAYEQSVATYLMKSANVDPSKFNVAYTLSEGQLYYSLSPDTPDEYVTKLQKGLDQIAQSGELDKIKSQYQ
ncbi:amino acid ABC transporter substrate-binding protein [Vibrio zhanjiangensis]|uniref:Amino acid ABC transporter substrate-binding protein n=1 Tax=Vibrio zhanjiangensis TaxID=1046128 RepID=A0ABQ6EWA3_9VIBR|nr:transporter substrate-binding domain-containing protein [Vibrio zhanjiangensis]GLT16966.1 amino acid ABC transporter substrate-binding protein [Vibrio zhanjiangensis]